MEALDRILSQIHQNSMTSQKSEANYKCNMCKDTTWLQTQNGFTRCKCYEKDKIKRLWENFGISLEKAKRINQYMPYDKATEKAKNKAINYVENFSEILKSDKNCYGLFGQNGAGKTHLVVGIGIELISKGIQVSYMPYVEAMRELKANAMDNEHYIKLSSRYQKAKVLIIDDLFKDKTKNGKLIADITDTDIKHFYPILNYRYNNNLPIVFSTECTPEMLVNLDEAQCGRIVEKSENYTVIFKGKEYNYRMKEFMKGE